MYTLVSGLGGGSSGGGSSSAYASDDAVDSVVNNYSLDLNISSERSTGASGLWNIIQTIRTIFADNREDKESMSTAFDSSENATQDSVFYIWLNPENLMIEEGG